MAKIATLYSGSSGNSTLLCGGGANILVDIGGSCRRTLKALYELGLAATDVNAIFITHEHSDHIGGLPVFLNHYDVPVFASAATLEYIISHCSLPKSARVYEAAGAVEVRGAAVRGFATPHDAADCRGYRFEFDEGAQAAVATDLGHINEEVAAALRGCGTVALESNYDENMLRVGRYPYYLKQRILSDFGHLSNDDCDDMLQQLARAGTHNFWLMHLSAENNTPDLAVTAALSALENIGAAQDCCVQAAARSSACAFREV